MSFLLIASFPDSLLRFRGALIDALISKGLEVHIAAPNILANEDVCNALLAKGVVLHDIPMQRTGMNPIKDFICMFALLQLMRTIKPRYVLGYTIKPVIYGSIAARLAGVPNRFALITGLGYAFVDQTDGSRSFLRRIAQALYRFALSGTHAVFFQNCDDRDLFKTLSLVPSGLVTHVVNGSGIDVDEYTITPIPDAPHFLLIARLLGDKGIREYVKAAELVKDQFPQSTFSLVGWIDDNPDAIKQSELDCWVSHGVINYLGRLDDVRVAISKSSVYVLPSYREGTPRTVLEAMAMGRPIITTDTPGCKETVVNGENGFLVPAKDVSALSDAMIELIKKPFLISKMGVRSRAIAEEKYDVHKVNMHMLNAMGIIK